MALNSREYTACTMCILHYSVKVSLCSLTHCHSPSVEVKYVGGKDPEMLFMNESGEVVKVYSIRIY